MVYAGLAILLTSCNQSDHAGVGTLVMLDCQFQNNGMMHLHIAPERGNANVISAYLPVHGKDHARSLRDARESKAQLVEAGSDRYVLDIFLLNDHFGENTGETVRLRLAKDGQGLIEARREGTPARRIDRGTCVQHNHHIR